MKDESMEKVDMPIFPSFKFLRPFIGEKRVLDVGCGVGRYLEQFSKYSVGLESSQEAVNEVKKRGLKILKCDVNKKFPIKDKQFDVVFASHIIEHVDSPFRFLSEVNRVLKKNGIVILGFPVEKSIVRIFGDHYFNDHYGHLYSFSINEIERLLIRNRFYIKRVFVDLNLVGRFPILNPLLDFVNKLPSTIVFWFTNAVWIVAQKTKE